MLLKDPDLHEYEYDKFVVYAGLNGQVNLIYLSWTK